MLSGVADAALRRPRAVLAATVGVLVLAAALAAAAPDRLALVLARSGGSESTRAADELRDALGQEAAPAVVILTRGRDAERSAVYDVVLDVITSQIEAKPEVAQVRRGPMSGDGRTTALEVYFRDDDPRAEQAATAELRRELDPGPLEILIGGEAGIADDARSGLWGELGPLELLALPITVIVLLIAFGLRLAAGPALAAAIGTLGSLGLIGLVNEATPLSLSGVAPAAVIAVALGIESCHLLAARYGGGLATLSGEDALRRAVDVAGRAIVIATLAAAAVAASLAVIPVLDARSAALGGALAALLSGAVSLAAMPSLLVLFGPRSAPEATGHPRQKRGRGPWYRLESVLTARLFVAAVLIVLPVAALVALAAPGLRTDTVPLDAAGLPSDSDARRAEVGVTAELGSEVTAPVLVSTESDDRSGLARLRWEGTEARPGSLGARAEIESIRDRSASDTEDVGGRDAAALDANRALLDHLPLAAGGAALILAVVLVMFVFRSVLPLPRAIASAIVLAVASKLPAAAAAGLLVLVFQDGRLTGLLGYTPEGGPELVAVVAVVGAVATVSAMRTVHFAATIAEERELGFDAAARVPRGASLTLPGVAASTTVLAAATIVLAGADLVAAKQLGLATAAGLVLDFVLLRVLLAPGLARLSQ